VRDVGVRSLPLDGPAVRPPVPPGISRVSIPRELARATRAHVQPRQARESAKSDASWTGWLGRWRRRGGVSWTIFELQSAHSRSNEVVEIGADQASQPAEYQAKNGVEEKQPPVGRQSKFLLLSVDAGGLGHEREDHEHGSPEDHRRNRVEERNDVGRPLSTSALESSQSCFRTRPPRTCPRSSDSRERLSTMSQVATPALRRRQIRLPK